jgi:hypothetical protein
LRNITFKDFDEKQYNWRQSVLNCVRCATSHDWDEDSSQIFQHKCSTINMTLEHKVQEKHS